MKSLLEDYAVEISTPNDDTYSRVMDKQSADALFDSITVSDDKVPRVSVYFIDHAKNTWYEVRRKATDAWEESVLIAREEEDNL